MRWFSLLSVLIGILSGEEKSYNQPNMTFDGQYRGRLDLYEGVNKAAYGDESINASGRKKGESDDAIYLQQLIAGFTYIPSDALEYKLYFYDARSWGSSLASDDFALNPGTPDEYRMDYYDDHHELYTSYVRLSHWLDTPLTLTLGRQKLGYGDRRVFGPGEWGNTMGWLWDAVHLSYKKERHFVDAWYGQTRIKEPNDFSLFQKHRYQGVGVYGHYEADEAVVEPFCAWKNPLHHATLPYQDLYYAGGRIYREGLGWNGDVTVVGERGRSGEKSVDAYAYVIKTGYRWEGNLEPKLMAGYTYASGDKNTNDGQIETFTTPFGMNDGPYYGRMDMMIWSNIKDIEASLSGRFSPKLNAQIEYHRFFLADSHDKWYEFGYKNKPGYGYTHLGDEADLTLRYEANQKLSMIAIASYFSPGDFIVENGIASNRAAKLFMQFEYRFSTKD